MAQEDYTISNADGATVRADINSHLSAIVSNNSGASAPATTFAFQFWADTSTGLLKIRNSANSAWVTIGTMADAFLGLADLDTAQTLTNKTLDVPTFTGNATFDTNTLFVDAANNRVGIGTSTPDTGIQLDVRGTGVLQLVNTDTVQLIASSGSSTLKNVSNNPLIFGTNNTARMQIAANGTTAVTPTSASAGQGFAVNGSGMANGSNMVFISMGTNTGNFISGNNSSGQQFSISHAGHLSKTSGSFKISHPLPSKNATHSLVHSFIEGPQADLIYRGTADLVSGVATVNIDTAAGMTEGTFVVLCTDVQCFTSNEDGWTALKGAVTGNILTITAQDDSCTDTVSWLVVGERCDPHMLETEWTDAAGKVIVEPLKPEPIEGE